MWRRPHQARKRSGATPIMDHLNFSFLSFCVLRFFGLEQVLTRVTSLYELAHAFPKLSESPPSSHKAVVYFGNRRYNARAPPIQHNCSSRDCVWSPWFELSGGCGVKRYMIYLSRAPLNCWQTSCYHTWQAVTLCNWVVECTTRAMRWAVIYFELLQLFKLYHVWISALQDKKYHIWWPPLYSKLPPVYYE